MLLNDIMMLLKKEKGSHLDRNPIIELQS